MGSEDSSWLSRLSLDSKWRWWLVAPWIVPVSIAMLALRGAEPASPKDAGGGIGAATPGIEKPGEPKPQSDGPKEDRLLRARALFPHQGERYTITYDPDTGVVVALGRDGAHKGFLSDWQTREVAKLTSLLHDRDRGLGWDDTISAVVETGGETYSNRPTVRTIVGILLNAAGVEDPRSPKVSVPRLHATHVFPVGDEKVQLHFSVSPGGVVEVEGVSELGGRIQGHAILDAEEAARLKKLLARLEAGGARPLADDGTLRTVTIDGEHDDDTYFSTDAVQDVIDFLAHEAHVDALPISRILPPAVVRAIESGHATASYANGTTAVRFIEPFHGGLSPPVFFDEQGRTFQIAGPAHKPMPPSSKGMAPALDEIR